MIVAGTALAPSGPEFTAPMAASTAACCAAGTCAADALKAASACASEGVLATLA